MAVWGRGKLKGFAQSSGEEIVVQEDSDVEVIGSSALVQPTTPRQAAGESTLEEKAAARLSEALGGSHQELASSIAQALVTAEGADAAHRLRALVAALRANDSLREKVLKEGTAIASKLATQDIRDWATDGLKAQREAWVKGSTAEASRLGGDVRSCPECGGRAVFETGSSPAYKMAKAFAHYKCMEVNCGKETHVGE